jgi:putative ABC transport system ATP-binding protein
MDILSEINREEKITMLIVTHEHDIAARTQKTIRITDGLITEIIKN